MGAGGFPGFVGVFAGFFDVFDHEIGFGNAGQDMFVVHAEALVGGEGVDADVDVLVDGEEEANAAAAFHETDATTVIDPSAADAGGREDVGFKGVPEEDHTHHAFLDVESDGLAAARRSGCGGSLRFRNVFRVLWFLLEDE